MPKCICCGKDEREIEKWTFCRRRKEWICRLCEPKCIDYSKDMLPNGTHCKYAFRQEDEIRRLLNKRIPALPSEVEKAKERYKDRLPGLLTEDFRRLAARYKITIDEQYRGELRTQLAAMQAILRERYSENCKQRFMFKSDAEFYRKVGVI